MQSASCCRIFSSFHHPIYFSFYQYLARKRLYRAYQVGIQSMYYMNRFFRHHGTVRNLIIAINSYITFLSDNKVDTPDLWVFRHSITVPVILLSTLSCITTIHPRLALNAVVCWFTHTLDPFLRWILPQYHCRKHLSRHYFVWRNPA